MVPSVGAARQRTDRARYNGGNRRAKQDQIVEAAKGVLARHGLAACTARAVAEASPLTKSAIHYYFNDLNEIIDRAMAAYADSMIETLARVAGQHAQPRERLWQVVQSYLNASAARPHAAFLWFEYWADAGRRQTLEVAGDMLGKLHALLAGMLSEVPVPDPDERAHALLSWLLGTVVQQHIRPRAAHVLRTEMTRIVAGGS